MLEPTAEDYRGNRQDPNDPRDAAIPQVEAKDLGLTPKTFQS